ncbi:MAG: D-glycero-alpha-D-manno-heptose-1,7-bisphosphate 7-phosphatase [Candidatus Melainabacteria bacterium]
MTDLPVRKAIFLDRDGTLNEERGYLRNVDDLDLIPGAAEAVKLFQQAGYLTVLTTNQSGVARGFYGEDHLHALHDRLQKLLEAQAGVRLHAIFYSPFLPPDPRKELVPEFARESRCRKPNPGMVEAACEEFPGIDLSQSWIIGDKATDVDFAVNCGCHSVLLKTGYGARVLEGKYQTLTHQPELICEDILEAAHRITGA